MFGALRSHFSAWVLPLFSLVCLLICYPAYAGENPDTLEISDKHLTIIEDFYSRYIKVVNAFDISCNFHDILVNGKDKYSFGSQFDSILIRNNSDSIEISTICNDTTNYLVLRDQEFFRLYYLPDKSQKLLLKEYRQINPVLKNCLFWVQIFTENEDILREFRNTIRRKLPNIGATAINMIPGDYFHFKILTKNVKRENYNQYDTGTIFIKYRGSTEELERLVSDIYRSLWEKFDEDVGVIFHWGPYDRYRLILKEYSSYEVPTDDPDSIQYYLYVFPDEKSNKIEFGLRTTGFVKKGYCRMNPDIRETQRGIELRHWNEYFPYWPSNPLFPYGEPAGARFKFYAPKDTFDLYVIAPPDTTHFIFSYSKGEITQLKREGQNTVYYNELYPPHRPRGIK